MRATIRTAVPDGPVDRSSRVGGPPTSLASEWIRLALRVGFFGGASVVCLVWRADETQTGNRNFLLVMALLSAALGVMMGWQSVLDILWLRDRRRFPSTS